MPRSSTARFTEKWQQSVGDEGFLDSIVDRWRNSSCASVADSAQHMAMFAESMSLTGQNLDAPVTAAVAEERAEPVRRDLGSIRREQPPAPPASATPAAQPGSALRTIRDRLQQR